MLINICISQFRTIEYLESNFANGLTVITGETGTGKSILIDALSLAVGGRTNPIMIRIGANSATVEAKFITDNQVRVKRWLEQHNLAKDNCCILRRTLSIGGRSKAFINGAQVMVSQLRELGGVLINLHRQNEHLRLLQRPEQLLLLDAYSGRLDLVEKVGRLFEQQKSLLQKFEECKTQAQNSDRLALLDYQLEELEQQNITADLLEDLNIQHKKLAHADEYRMLTEQVLESLYTDDNSLLSTLVQVCGDLEKINLQDDNLQSALDLLSSGQVHLEEAVRELRVCNEGILTDPDKLKKVQESISVIHELARKHKLSPRDLPQYTQQLRAEKQLLEDAVTEVDKLQERLQQGQSEYRKVALQLRAIRQEKVKDLELAVTACLPQLGMQNGRFFARLSESAERPAITGIDELDFFVSGGKSQKPCLLSQVASGGELSRISLALQLIIAKQVQLPTLVFDEADTGVGGGIAEMIGLTLRQLAEHTQVLCVTHLPQVAVQGHQHQRLLKRDGENAAITELMQLTEDNRADEIARMIGGIDITLNAKHLALEMLDIVHNKKHDVADKKSST